MLPVDGDPLFEGKVIEKSAQREPMKTARLSRLIDLSLIEIGLPHVLLWASLYFLMVSLLTLPAVLAKYEWVQREGSLSS